MVQKGPLPGENKKQKKAKNSPVVTIYKQSIGPKSEIVKSEDLDLLPEAIEIVKQEDSQVEVEMSAISADSATATQEDYFTNLNKTEPTSLTNMLPESIYLKLPLLLQKGSNVFQSRRERDVFLTGAITVIGGCFPNVLGIYDGREVYPYLFSFVAAPPSSGKGVLKYAKAIAEKIHQALVEDYFKQRKGTNESLPKLLFIPGNISSAAIIKQLDQNNGVGIICETEADTLATSLNQKWGSFSEQLRSAFHHESITFLRSTNNEYIEIAKPKLSITLSGTPEQIKSLIVCTDNGLFSRMIYYTFYERGQYRDVSPEGSKVNYDMHFRELAEEFEGIYTKMNDKSYLFELSKQQWSELNILSRNNSIFISGYVNEDLTEIAFRMGLIQYRIAMILSILRHHENGNTNEKTIKCSKEDFTIAAEMVAIYIRHSVEVAKLLPGKQYSKINNRELKFFLNLPEGKFTRQEALQIAEKLGIPERTCNEYLKNLRIKGFIKQGDKAGDYEKTAIA